MLTDNCVVPLTCVKVCTLFVGFGKLTYDRVQAKKYTKVEKGKQAATPEMLEAQPISEQQTKDDIRAIESGIEVDGVWISRSNTPVGSSRSSITNVQLPRSYTSSQVELPMPKPIHGSSSRASVTSSFDRAVSAERIQNNESRSSSPGRQGPMAGSSRQHSNPNYQRNSSTLQALEGVSDSASSSMSRTIRTVITY
jgi:hypothetical protein